MSRHSRLLFLLAPGLTFSNVAFALTIHVTAGPTVDGCDPDVDLDCTVATVKEAIDLVNASNGTGPFTIQIEDDYAPPSDGDGDNAEIDLPVITYPVTIRSNAVDPSASAWRLRTLRAAQGANLTLENLAIKSGELTYYNGSFNEHYAYSAVDAEYADVTGDNIVLEQGDSGGEGLPNGRSGMHGIWIREGDLDLDGVTGDDFYGLSGGEYDNSGAVIFFDDNNSSDRHTMAIASGAFNGNYGSDDWQGSVVYARGAGTATITSSVFNGNDNYPVYYEGDDLTVANSTFFGGEGGVYFSSYGAEGRKARLHIYGDAPGDSTFEDNYGYYTGGPQSAVFIYGGTSADYWYDRSTGVDALIERTSFNGNYSYGGYGSADLGWYSDAGTLDVAHSQFADFEASGIDDTAGGSVYIEGGKARFTDVTWDGGLSGAEGYNADGGGALFLAWGDVECVRCDFSNVGAYAEGGAVQIAGERYEDCNEPWTPPWCQFRTRMTTAASFTDSTFDATWAMYAGGAIYAGEGASVELHSTRFTDTWVDYDGGAIYLSGSEGGVGVNPLPTLGASYSFGGQDGVRLIGDDVTFDYALSGYDGGVVYAERGGNTVKFTNSSFTDTMAGFYGGSSPALAGQSGSYPGSGGVIYAEPGNRIEVSDSQFTRTNATEYGGAFYSESQSIQEQYTYSYSCGEGSTCYNGGSYPKPQVPYAGDPSEACWYPYGDLPQWSDGDWVNYSESYSGAPYGTEWLLTDNSFNGGSSGEGGSVAYFGRFDDATVTGSTFTENVSYGPGTIMAASASRLHISCNTFCSNESEWGGSAIEVFDDAMPSDFYLMGSGPGNGIPGWENTALAAAIGIGGPGGSGQAKDVRYTIENNVFEGGTTYSSYRSGAVHYEMCDVSSFFFGGEGYDGNVARGDVDVVNNTFAGNSGGEGNLVGGSGDVRIDVRNDLFQDGIGGWFIRYGSSYVEHGYNLYGDFSYLDGEDVLQEGYDVIDQNGQYNEPDETDQIDAALFAPYTGEDQSCGAELYLLPNSPGVDDGDPYRPDNWGPPDEFGEPLDNLGDIGAYGGPHACIGDYDCDTFNAYLDCDDEARATFPEADEVPYDGTDQDCDGADLCDVDADGHDADFDACSGDDCNDLDPTIHPGATEVVGDGVDQDCNGDDGDTCPDADGDGFDAASCGGNDCNDASAAINPAADDIPDNGIDEDCSDGDRECDADDDGENAIGCPDGTDCDDTDATIGLTAEEIPYDGIDQDCHDGDMIDVDCDHYVAEEVDCDPENLPEGMEGCGDCIDEDAATHPDADDNPLDNIDQDCEGGPAQLWAQGGQCGCDTPATTPMSGAVGLFGIALAFLRRRGRG